jgi:hypothetical protein
MDQQQPDVAETSSWLSAVLAGVFLLAIVAFAIALVVYTQVFSGGLSTRQSDWAEFGDFLGGTLGPAFSLLGLLALLLTLHIQNREFTHSVRALNKQAAALTVQNFESTFFEMIRLHHDIVQAIDLQDKKGRITRGRDCFRVFYERFRKNHSDANGRYQGSAPAVIATKAYDVFFAEHQHEIGHYFRNFHRILKLVDESRVLDKSNYTGILRAQMSSAELALLFYNAIHPVGEKLKPLLEHYEILESLDISQLCNPPDEVSLINRMAFGDNRDVVRYLGPPPKALS